MATGRSPLSLPPLPSPLKLEGSNGSSGSSGSSSEVAPFISKVWSIVNDESILHLVAWSESGKTFLVLDEPRFSKDVLPKYFKHNNFASFVRQLNLYGFRKVAKPDQGALLKSSGDSVEFWHANFRRDHPELLNLVQRRPVSSRTGGDDKNACLSQVINDIHSVKGNQTNIEGMMNELKRENIHLKQEIAILKEKHKHQHRLLNKIIHFIVHLLYKGTLPTKRSRLMLTDVEDSLLSPPTKRISLDPPSPIGYSVQSPLAPPLPINSLPSSSSVIPPVSSRVDDPLPPSDGVGGAVGDGDFLEELLTSSLPPSSYSNTLVPVSQSQPIDVQSILEPQLETNPESALSLALQKQHDEIESLKSQVPDQLSIDPLILTEFINSSEFLPDYDFIDTARLLESVSSESEMVPNEEMIQNALIPYNPVNQQ
ncbi:PREDICTED: heat shock factor protein-like [Amphimedon queenslandica]|uniref:HSF-type DNA-binding domain-containing protein n=1 Tax=Amphimedon queenslandica TaxID=400682 RepID=A0A1X7U3F0_AMPQE|nr:PREDICTED: heat shock factor protein-like [Amphimedon queenslandica]|eukprot:XP_019856235.1 PREDICTED: heat shock factor protein-like [Amphimedon queenslandica]